MKRMINFYGLLNKVRVRARDFVSGEKKNIPWHGDCYKGGLCHFCKFAFYIQMFVKAWKIIENSAEITKEITYKGEKCKFRACFHAISKICAAFIRLQEESFFFALALCAHTYSDTPSSFSFLSVHAGCPDLRELFVLSLHEVPVLN